VTFARPIIECDECDRVLSSDQTRRECGHHALGTAAVKGVDDADDFHGSGIPLGGYGSGGIRLRGRLRDTVEIRRGTVEVEIGWRCDGDMVGIRLRQLIDPDEWLGRMAQETGDSQILTVASPVTDN
jgi:hypothetical protein